MTSIEPVDSDYTVDTNDGHVIVQDIDGREDARIVQAIFFSKNRIELREKIKNSVNVSDPTGVNDHVKILFYSSLSMCKKKLRAMSSNSLIMTHPRRHLSVHGHGSTPSSSRVNDSYPLDGAEVTSQLNSLKRSIEFLSSKIDQLISSTNERFTNVEDKLDSTHNSSGDFRDPSLKITDIALTEISNCRNDTRWRKRIKNMEWPYLTAEQADAVRKELLKNNKSVSKTVISLARIIYGDKLKTHLLGNRGKPVRAAREGERSLVIPEVEEKILRAILENFGKDLFSDPTNWEVLVRGPVNQSGRERKRKRNNTEIESDLMPESGEATEVNDEMPSKRVRQNSNENFESENETEPYYGHQSS